MKKTLWAIFVLTVVDVVSTNAGLRMGIIEEANPIMFRPITSHPAVTSVLIVIYTGAVLYGIYKVRNKIKWLPPVMVAILVGKVFIAGLHVYWILLVI